MTPGHCFGPSGSSRERARTSIQSGCNDSCICNSESHTRRLGGIPDFLTSDDMVSMVAQDRIDPKMVFSYVQEVYRMCNDL